ncbi:hypothetical protein B0H13DRAFT_2557202 [Mycena leptocephala]|nr:hypothetical protein B0H13DRAFT_2557202 [Mycena leptocephala]
MCCLSVMKMHPPRSLPRPPQTQALRSPTFKPPPLDGSLTIAQIYDWHFQHTLFIDCSSGDLYGCTYFRKRFEWTPGMREMPVVAILASSDTIPYFILVMSCLRANYVPFPISPRNSPSAVANLISKAGVRHLLIGHEPAMAHLAEDAIGILKEEYSTTAAPDVLRSDLPFEYHGPDAAACIIHSSGSTAFPKPICWTNHHTQSNGFDPLVWRAMPMYHGMGILQMFWAASSGLVLSAFEPKSPPTIPTPENLFLAAKATGSDIIFCVPSFIEAWSCKPEYVQWLATRAGVLYGGGPLNKDAGDYMTSQGVSIFILYGFLSEWEFSSEGSIMSPVLPAQVGYDWEYFRFRQTVTAEMVPHGNNTFELVMVSNEFSRPAVLNTKIEGIDAYATSDLLVPHPVKPGYWKVHGRADDQIMHNTGEKVNRFALLSFEIILNQDPHVSSSVIFGRGHFQAGVIVDPKPAFKFDPSDLANLAEFRNRIWPTVVKMNNFAPQHSRIFKEFEQTATLNIPSWLNGTRHRLLTLYETLSTTLWQMTSETMKIYFNTAVTVYKRPGFETGLLGALRDLAQLDTRRDTDNFVYEYPTISQLAAFVFGIASGQHEEETSVETKAKFMREMVKKYVQDFPTHTGERKLPTPAAKVVLVTGRLESWVVIYCHFSCRMIVWFMSTLSTVLLPSKQLYVIDKPMLLSNVGWMLAFWTPSKLSLLTGDVSRPGFGLATPVYQQMHQGVTHIVHTAWPVDFNLALRSFEPNIKGLRNLLDFSLDSPFMEPRRLLYTSTIGIFQRINGAWNISEWVPALVQSAQFIKCIPDDSRDVTWLPVHIAAAAIIDFLETAPGTQIVHLINPRPVTWSTLANIIAADRGVPLVPYTEWLSQLENVAQKQTQEDSKSFRALRLLPFFRSQNHQTAREAFGFPRLDAANAISASKSLRSPGCQLGEKDVKEWIRYWREAGFL